MHMSAQKKTHIVLISVLSALVFANTLPGNFVWDDEIQIVKNWRIRTLENIGSAFTTAFWSFLGTAAENQTNFYRPVQTVTYTLAYSIGGLSPVPYHAFSLLYHTTAGIFVYLIGIELMLNPAVALAIAALFAVHPIHTEAVAWIAGIPDVACGAFYFGAVWLFLKRRQWMACGMFFLALLSKEMAVTLPLFLLLIPLPVEEGGATAGRPPRGVRVRGLGKNRPHAATVGARVKYVLPFSGVLAVYFVIRIYALGFLATSHFDIQARWVDWISLVPRVLGDYIRYALVPYPLSAFHLVPLKFEYRIASTVLGLSVILLAAGLTWWFRTRLPQAILWFAAFVVTLIPVFYFKGMSNTFFAERYLYIPSFAMIALVVTTVSSLKIPKWNWIVGAVAVAFAIAAAYRNTTWWNSEQLYETTLAVQPEVAHMRINLADIHLKRNEDEAARNLLSSAEQYMQSDEYVRYPYELYRTYVGLGAIEARAGDYDRAREHFKKAIEVNPAGDWGYLYLGGVYMEADRDYSKAIQNFEKAMQLGPLNEVARDYFGVAMLNQKNYGEAIHYFQEALKINPNYQDARSHLAIAAQAKPQ